MGHFFSGLPGQTKETGLSGFLKWQPLIQSICQHQTITVVKLIQC